MDVRKSIFMHVFLCSLFVQLMDNPSKAANGLLRLLLRFFHISCTYLNLLLLKFIKAECLLLQLINNIFLISIFLYFDNYYFYEINIINL